MRTVTFITLVTERASNKVHALYTVVDADAEGARKRLVRVSIDINGLASLAHKACDNPSGEATLHFRDIIAKVQE